MLVNCPHSRAIGLGFERHNDLLTASVKVRSLTVAPTRIFACSLRGF